MEDKPKNADGTLGTLALAENLRRIVSKFVRGVRLAADTPTNSQTETLALLEINGPSSVAALAALRNVRHQSMRLVIAQLEKDKLVTKVANPNDARSHFLILTAEGHHALTRSRDARTTGIATLIDEKLSDLERQKLNEAIRILERLV